MPPDANASVPEPALPAPEAPGPFLPPPPVSPWSRDAFGAPLPEPDLAGATIVDPVAPGELQRPRRSKLVLGGAVVAVLAVGAAGVFAVSRFNGATAGGAGDPTELGTQLLTAIENEDVLGMVDVLAPGERDLFREPMIDMVNELVRLEVLAPEADLAKIAGVDIELDRETVTARQTNVPDIVNVDLSAEATSTVDGETVPIGDLITDNLDADAVAEIRGTDETTTEEFEVSLTAVEQDGRWYFSLFHTAAEELRGGIEPEPDIPAEGIGADGADSPEAAVDSLLDRIESLDLAGMIRILNPGEAAALQRYAPLFLAEAEAALAEVPIELEITDRQFRVEGDGDQRTVLIDGLTISGRVDEQGTDQDVEFEVSIEGTCTRAVFADETFEACAGDAASMPEVDEFLAEATDVRAFVDALGRALADIEPIGLELRSHDGRWFVSPTATVTESVLAVLRALDRQELDELIELGEAAADQLFEMIFGGFATYEDEYDDESYEVYDESLDDYVYDESLDDGLDDPLDDASYEAPAWDRCYTEIGAAEATACFQEYVATGEIDVTYIPVELRFPECGYADIRWSGALYSLPDAEFIAAVEAARPCFMALVESGQIQQYELPSEIANLECFEGRNWYNVFDDPEYDERYYACLEAAFAEPGD
jgi:hypothetical protein